MCKNNRGFRAEKMRDVEVKPAKFFFFKVYVWVDYGVIGLEIFYYMRILNRIHYNNMIIFITKFFNECFNISYKVSL